MSANRFATMVHRSTNKITLILIYAVLEWVLIVLLLLNSLFSYLILKFAEFFGLKPPCLWCTRIDHVFDASKGGKNLHRDHLCEAHAKEVSRLGFCPSHQKLVEFQNLCGDCLSEFEGLSKNVSAFSVVKDCSCCGLSLDCNKYASWVVLKTSSWDVLECAQKLSLVAEAGENGEKTSQEELEGKKEDQMVCEFNGILEVTEKGCDSEAVYELKGDDGDDKKEKATLLEETSDLYMEHKSVQMGVQADASAETSAPHLEFCLDYSGHTLVPIEMIDSVAENTSKEDAGIEDRGRKVQEVSQYPQVWIESNESSTFIDVDINEEPNCFMEIEDDENTLVFHSKPRHLTTEEFDVFETFPLLRWSSEEVVEASMRSRSSDAHSDNATFEEVARESNGNEADVSIGTEIPDLDVTDEVRIQDSVDLHECILDDPSLCSADLCADEDCGPKQEEMLELHQTNDRPSFCFDPNEMEEEKVPNTPSSVESLNQLHNKLLMLEKRDFTTEESGEGSVTSELEGSDGVVTVECLKSALRAERKALQVLYSELEEERSASAVAASQTMAMINRLQEEKAAMQMEALQYQRMMEEQSEYDQEALQLLNELMVKREKEKQELERELEGYRKKLLDYETKEKMRMLRRSKDGSNRSLFSSTSCSEDSDGLSIDLNREAKEEDGFCSNTPVEAVLNLEESLADFEAERLAILEQLKVLEEKLLTLDDDDNDENGQHFEDVREMDHSINSEANGHSNGCTHETTTNGNDHHLHHPGSHQQQGRLLGHKGKSLLPLFDATADENGGTVLNGNGNEYDHNVSHDSCEPMLEMENKKLAIEEEVDHLYERLQALEADREFLKHCISSLKKGDKGMDLLQEILQHLRDLRNVDLRVRSLGDSSFI